MAKWIRRRFPEPKIVGSSPIWDASVFLFVCFVVLVLCVILGFVAAVVVDQAKKIFAPRLELGTSRVLGERHNQLDHANKHNQWSIWVSIPVPRPC